MRVTIFGLGAMAMLLGARLQRAGADVTLAGRWLECLNVIRRSGITVEEDDLSWSAEVETIDLAQRLPSWSQAAELVLVLVKGHQTSQIAPNAARMVARNGSVLTLQNGLGNAQTLSAAGASRVAQGTTSLGARVVVPGRVRSTGTGRTVLPANQTAALELFDRADLDCEGSEDIQSNIWMKLAVNCAINPLGALEGMANGELLTDPRRRKTLEAAAREVGAVASALGIVLPGDPAAEAVSVAFRTAGNRSSMLQDLDRGAPTEIEVITGAVVTRARKLDVPVPVNEHLRRRVLEIEAEAARLRPIRRRP